MNYVQLDDGAFTTLRVRGELDAISSSELRPLLDHIVADAPRHVTVDLSELRLIDGAGVAALVSLDKRVRAHGGQVLFTGVAAQPLIIFKLLRLDRVFAFRAEGPPVSNKLPAVSSCPSAL